MSQNAKSPRKIFKPIIATSLALILGSGFLSARDVEINDANSTESTAASIDNLIYGNGSQEKKLTLQADGNTITSLVFKDPNSPSTNNFLVLNLGKTIISNQVNVGNEQAIVFDLSGNAELSIAGGISGSGKSRVRMIGSGTSTLSGGALDGTTLEFSGGESQEIKLQNSNANLTDIELDINSSNEKTLTLDASNNSVIASVSEEISGNQLKLNFGGKNIANRIASLTLNSNKESTIKRITLANTSSATDNTLTLNAGNLVITDTVEIDNAKGITFHLDTATLQGNVVNNGAFNLDFTKQNGVFEGSITTRNTSGNTSAITNIQISDDSSGNIAGAVATNSGETHIKFANGSNAKTLTLKSGDNSLSSIIFDTTAPNSTNNTLILQQGNTTITQQVAITAQQGLTFDLKNTANLTLSGDLSNAGNAGIKFNGANTLTSSISTTAGNTQISLANGAKAAITKNISTSGGETTITFNGSSTLILNDETTTTGTGKTLINFKSTKGVFQGRINTQGGETEIFLYGGANGVITGGITTANNASANIKYSGISTLTLQGTTNTITSLDTSGTQGTLKVDASSNANTTTIKNAILGDKLIVELGGTESQIATLSLSNNSNSSSTIKTLRLTNKTTKTQNVFSLLGGTTTLTDGVNIGNEQGLTLSLSNNATLTSNVKNTGGSAKIVFATPQGGKLQGTIATTSLLGSSGDGTTIIINDASKGIITENVTTGENANTTIIFDTGSQASELTLQGKTNQINTITVNGDSKTLILDGKSSSGGVNAEIKTAIVGGKLTAKLNGEANKTTNLALNASGNTLKALVLGNNSTHNKFILNSGNTTITDKVSINSTQALDFDLNNTSNLTLTGNLENSGNSNINFSGTSTLTSSISTSGTTNINIAGDSNGTITKDVSAQINGTTNVFYSSSSKENSLKLLGNNNTLNTISFDLRSQSGKLILGDGSSANNTIITNNILGDSIAGGKLIVEFNGSSHSSHLTLNGNSNALKTLELYGIKNTLTLASGESTIQDWVRVEASKGITFDINSATLTLTNSFFNEAGQALFSLSGKSAVKGDITTKSEPFGTTIYLSDNNTSPNKGTEATLFGTISKDSQSSMGFTTLQFASGTNSKKITLQAKDNILTSITLGDTANPPTPNTSTNNTLALTNGNTTIESEAEIQTSQALTFDLGNGTNLALSNNLQNSGGNATVNFAGISTLSSSITTTTSGTTTLNIADGANGSVSGDITNSGTTNIKFATVTNPNTNSLTLNGDTNQITTMTIQDNGNSSLKGKNAIITTLELGDTNGNSKLTLFNTQSTITTLTPSSGETMLSLDGSFNATSASITNAVSGNNLTLNFNGKGDSNKTELELQAGDNTFKALTLGTNSTANKLTLQNGKTQITEKINVANTQEITLDLGDSTELALTGGMDTSGSSSLQVVVNGSNKSATLSGDNASATHLKLTGDTSNSASITLKNPQVNFTTLITSGSAENTLTLDTSSNANHTTITQAISGDNLVAELKGTSTNTAILSLKNANNETNTTSTIKSLTLGASSANTTTAYNTLELQGGITNITDSLTIDNSKGINFDFSGSSSLSFGSNPLTNSGGVLTLNFKQGEGIFDGSISTSSGNTNIDISDSASGSIRGDMSGSGTTTIKFASGTSQKSLTLQGSTNTITSLALDDTSSSTHNIFNLETGTTTIDQKLEIKTSQELTTTLGSNANLTLTNHLENSGEHTINFNGTTHALTSTITTKTGGTTTLALSSNTHAEISGDITSEGSTNLNLTNASSLTLRTKLSTTAGDTTINFNGESGNITGNIETKNNATTTFNLGTSNLQTTTTTLIDNPTTEANSNQIFNINATNTTLKVGDEGLNFSNGKNTINLKAQNSTLQWQNKDGVNKDIKTTGGSTKIDFQNDGAIQASLLTSGGETNIEVQNNTMAIINGALTTENSATTTLKLKSQSTGIISENIANRGSGATNLEFSDSNSALILKGGSNTLSKVSIGSGSNIISLSDGENHDKRASQDSRRKLTIESITKGNGSLTLISQTTATNADTFIIKGATKTTRATQPSTLYNLGIVVANGVRLSDIGRSGEILVASVKTTSGIEFAKTSQVISGFTTATATFSTKTTDEHGGDKSSDYTSYFIKSMQNAQVIAAEQEITATAFTLNYDLYVANFNSLNKRMGELRENPYSQGIWARVFNGALSNDFGLKTKTNYTTIQAGYDYAFGSEGANNYLGFALSYALSTSTSEHAFDDKGQKRSIDSIYSNAIEVALYNSYVSDEGWYNDTIAKFSYLMSDFKINNITDPSNTTSTNNDTQNFALTLSDEVGYKFALGESKEWGITPQLELGFGYFNQSHFKQTLQDLGAFLQSNADSVLTLRARVGSSFSYDFKAFCNPKTFNASLYLGTFYEYDYVSGGEIKFRTDQITQDTTNNLSHLQSDGRVVLNIGTNMTIKESTRLYIDFEKSFAGKINTDYQINFGVRYSFGEGSYTPLPQPIEQKAPLKIEDTPNNNEQNKLQ